ncbi:glycerate kinase [Dactylosporangium sp. AC04546]|uniref:glycerate kinase family protein n=1 Tax=Dactylosporangium sp. AC04546 TaxID=2862460 RepID=UPI001EE13CB3|nr:glycerate kinase [Dactylosporangium sp. AC04546]WVK82233.1 glycerate kinase [Dactylosporangium sp. AC04546]
MRVLVCPDKFAGTIPAVEAATAFADGWSAEKPSDDVVLRPLSDGGPGFVAVLAAALPRARVITVPTTDPLGRPVEGHVLVDGDTAYVESAEACGLHLLAPGERDPKVTTTFGLGTLLLAAVEAGATTVVVGLGGSATNDGGAGLLAALGAAPLDAAGYALPYGGAALAACASLGGTPRLREATLVAATDVDSPLLGLHGATSVFGPQKGASREDVLLLDAALERFAQVLAALPTAPAGLAALPGAGAAGGLGAALLALGGRVESGIGLVRRLTGLDAELDEAGLVVTGEGSFDEQSLRGKVVAGVANAARDRGVPCVVVAGRVAAGRREAASIGVTEAHSLVEHFQSVEEALSRPGDGLRELGQRLARQWSR